MQAQVTHCDPQVTTSQKLQRNPWLVTACAKPVGMQESPHYEPRVVVISTMSGVVLQEACSHLPAPIRFSC